MNLDLSHLAEMTAADEARFFTIFDRQLEYDSGEEARSNLLSGVPIYYAERNWICPYISRHLLSLNPLQARCRRYSRGER